eukprot:scaffold10462_cov119-Isochrysis_galbana.AAC.3
MASPCRPCRTSRAPSSLCDFSSSSQLSSAPSACCATAERREEQSHKVPLEVRGRAGAAGRDTPARRVLGPAGQQVHEALEKVDLVRLALDAAGGRAVVHPPRHHRVEDLHVQHADRHIGRHPPAPVVTPDSVVQDQRDDAGPWRQQLHPLDAQALEEDHHRVLERDERRDRGAAARPRDEPLLWAHLHPADGVRPAAKRASRPARARARRASRSRTAHAAPPESVRAACATAVACTEPRRGRSRRRRAGPAPAARPPPAAATTRRLGAPPPAWHRLPPSGKAPASPPLMGCGASRRGRARGRGTAHPAGAWLGRGRGRWARRPPAWPLRPPAGPDRPASTRAGRRCPGKATARNRRASRAGASRAAPPGAAASRWWYGPPPPIAACSPPPGCAARPASRPARPASPGLLAQAARPSRRPRRAPAAGSAGAAG